MSEWQTIETAPKDGSIVDLWIRGSNPEIVKFYCPKIMAIDAGFEGRSTNWAWMHKNPNTANWYEPHGLGFPLSPDVSATHFMTYPARP